MGAWARTAVASCDEGERESGRRISLEVIPETAVERSLFLASPAASTRLESVNTWDGVAHLHRHFRQEIVGLALLRERLLQRLRHIFLTDKFSEGSGGAV